MVKTSLQQDPRENGHTYEPTPAPHLSTHRQ